MHYFRSYRVNRIIILLMAGMLTACSSDQSSDPDIQSSVTIPKGNVSLGFLTLGLEEGMEWNWHRFDDTGTVEQGRFLFRPDKACVRKMPFAFSSDQVDLEENIEHCFDYSVSESNAIIEGQLTEETGAWRVVYASASEDGLGRMFIAVTESGELYWLQRPTIPLNDFQDFSVVDNEHFVVLSDNNHRAGERDIQISSLTFDINSYIPLAGTLNTSGFYNEWNEFDFSTSSRFNIDVPLTGIEVQEGDVIDDMRYLAIVSSYAEHTLVYNGVRNRSTGVITDTLSLWSNNEELIEAIDYLMR